MLLRAYETKNDEIRLFVSTMEDQKIFEDIFEKYKREQIILNNNYSDNVYTVWNHHKKRTIDFTKITYAPKNMNIRDYIRIIKNYFLGKINNEEVYVVGEAERINEFIKISEETKGFTQMKKMELRGDLRKPIEGLSEEMGIKIEKKYLQYAYSKSGQRELADSFITYYVVDDELKEFWEKASEEEKMVYFPLYLFWVVCNIIPTRPYEFCITAYDCLIEKDGKFYLLLRKTPNKGNVYDRKKINNVKKYPILSVNIPSWIGKEIQWYKEKTEKYNTKNEYLFTNEPVNSVLNRKYDELFQTKHLSALKDMFMAKLVNEKGYKYVNEERNNVISYAEKWVTDWLLGDLRHLALINMVENQVDPSLIMRYAGHSDITSACHYYTNASEYSRNRIFYMKSKKFLKRKGVDIKKTQDEAPDPVDGGDCYHNLGKEDNYCAKVGGCKNCRYFVPQDGYEERVSDKIDYLYKHFVDLMFKKEIEEAKETLVELQGLLGKRWEENLSY